MEINRLLELVSEAGRILLESGAETYRVEETMVRITNSFGASAQSFVTPTGIMFSLTYNGHTHTKILRVYSRKVDLHKIHLINNLSRNLQNYTLDEVADELDNIRNAATYNYWTTVLFAGISAAGFSLFFRGYPSDWLLSFIAGVVLQIIVMQFTKLRVNSFFNNTMSTALVIGMLLSLWQFGLIENYDNAAISVIMLLVPGIAITNSIRDYVAGDLVSGLTRSLEAFLIALSIAVGAGFVFSLWTFLFGGIS